MTDQILQTSNVLELKLYLRGAQSGTASPSYQVIERILSSFICIIFSLSELIALSVLHHLQFNSHARSVHAEAVFQRVWTTVFFHLLDVSRGRGTTRC
jgi:hypothetical protein